MDFISEHSAEKIGQRHQAVNNNIIKGGKATTQIAVLATALLIQKILDRLKQIGSHKGPGLVEIKVDNKLVYKGIAGQKPEVDKLTPEHKKMLDTILFSPERSFNKDLQISVDREVSYKSENGIEKVNKLNSPNNEQSLSQEVNNISALTSGQRILVNANSNSFENENYRIEKDIVIAKDGRGEIAQIDKSGKVTGSVTADDKIALSEISNEVALQNEVTKSQQPINQSENVEKNQSQTKPQTSIAATSVNQESEELER